MAIVITGRDIGKEWQEAYRTRCSLRRFSGQILTQAWQILEKHGPAGYKALWVNHEFPLTQYERLEGLVRDRGQRYTCPCCGHRTLPNPIGRFDICPVCYWEADLVQSRDPDYEGGANRVSLRQAQQNYAAFGASEERFLPNVRPPREEEASN